MIYTNVSDLRTAAKRKLPSIFFDYLEGGAFSQYTLWRNVADFEQWWLEEKVLVNIENRNLTTTILGKRAKLPIMLGPVGFAGLFWPHGEICIAEAARSAGIPMCLSTFSVDPMESVAPILQGNLAAQLYVFRDRGLVEALLDRAAAAGVDTLFLTVDTDVSSVRERDTRNGFRTARRLSWRPLVSCLRKPSWCLRMLRGGVPKLGNVAGANVAPRTVMHQAAYLSENVDPRMSWRDVEWLRSRWRGKLVLKGILSVHDALRAMETGVDGIVVSNHGGRQLDCARSSISALPEIAAAIAGHAEIFFDGGIRRGTQIIKALALGADAVLLGRSYAYGLAADGSTGVKTAIDLLATEMDITLALMGVTKLSTLKSQPHKFVVEDSSVKPNLMTNAQCAECAAGQWARRMNE